MRTRRADASKRVSACSHARGGGAHGVPWAPLCASWFALVVITVRTFPLIRTFQLVKNSLGRIYRHLSLLNIPQLPCTYRRASDMPSITIKAAAEGTKDANAGTEDVSHSLVIFLQSQSQNMLTRLYQKPSACLSIFRWDSCVSVH